MSQYVRTVNWLVEILLALKEVFSVMEIKTVLMVLMRIPVITTMTQTEHLPVTLQSVSYPTASAPKMALAHPTTCHQKMCPK